jgi:hypothetical protein
MILFESDNVVDGLRGFSTVMIEALLFATSATSFSAGCFDSILAGLGLNLTSIGEEERQSLRDQIAKPQGAQIRA